MPETDDLGYVGEMPFLHSVASGDPLHDRVIFWTRITEDGSLSDSEQKVSSIPVSYVVATDADFQDIVTSGTTFALKEHMVRADGTRNNDEFLVMYAETNGRKHLVN